MKSFLKAIAKIAAIIALIAIMVTLISWTFGDATGTWSNTNWFGWESPSWLTGGFVISLAIGVLVLAAVISPKGFDAGIKRVSNATRRTAKALADIPKDIIEGVTESWGPLLLVAGAACLVFFGLRKKSDQSLLVGKKGTEAREARERVLAQQPRADSDNGDGSADTPQIEDLF